MGVAIRAGQDVLGSLWVAFPEQAPIGDHEATLREGAAVAALHLLALRQQLDADQDSRNRALRAVVDSQSNSDASETQIRLPGVLIGLTDSAGPPADPGQPTDLMRMLHLVAFDGRLLGYEPAATVIDGRLYALLAGTTTAVPPDRLLDHLLERAHKSLRRRYTVVRSETAGSLAALLEARHDIDAALNHLHDSDAPPGSYRTEELRTDLVLRRILETIGDNEELRTGMAERIAAHDAAHGTAYLATVSAYLRHFGDIVPASATLHIHQNTLRQRLRKAEQIFGLSLGDPALRLVLALEIGAMDRTGFPRSRPGPR
jgi:hypothetical protein